MLTFKDIYSIYADKEGQSALEALRKAHIQNHVTAYRIGKSLRSLEQANHDLNERRDAMIAEYGATQDENGNEVAPFISMQDSVRLKAFSDSFGQFLKAEPVGITIYPVKLEDLGDVELPTGVFEHLWFLFADPEA